jgi:DinB family protein
MQYLALQKGEQVGLLAELEEMPTFLESAFGSLKADQGVVRAADGSFSPVEQCWHLADLEREGFGSRIGRLLREDDPELPDFDGARVAEERRYRTLSLAEGLRAFRAARAETLALLRTIDGETWKRTGRQEGVGVVMLCDLPSMMAQHDAAHRGEIEAWLRERDL